MTVCIRLSTASLRRGPAGCAVAMRIFDDAVIIERVVVEVDLAVVDDIQVARLDGDREQQVSVGLLVKAEIVHCRAAGCNTPQTRV